ncbi:hypothetical protein E2C01_035674 [Portunus trituberculatus]|uniref:Uncharacterized protein n=1 Tax=Portunus trituberculatus TaxID=210409 RepID=A0A5B7F6J0_PORTR|nr:hypothetical protein [Portunus trituberculatus]
MTDGTRGAHSPRQARWGGSLLKAEDQTNHSAQGRGWLAVPESIPSEHRTPSPRQWENTSI